MSNGFKCSKCELNGHVYEIIVLSCVSVTVLVWSFKYELIHCSLNLFSFVPMHYNCFLLVQSLWHVTWYVKGASLNPCCYITKNFVSWILMQHTDAIWVSFKLSYICQNRDITGMWDKFSLPSVLVTEVKISKRVSYFLYLQVKTWQVVDM